MEIVRQMKLITISHRQLGSKAPCYVTLDTGDLYSDHYLYLFVLFLLLLEGHRVICTCFLFCSKHLANEGWLVLLWNSDYRQIYMLLNIM